LDNILTKVLNDVKERVGEDFDEQDESLLKIDIHRSIPELLMDNTDRNRTSPFAFTGNKFEFRAVGSSANCANPMTVLNTIMAQTLKDFKKDVDALIEKGEKKEIAIIHTIREYIVSSERILFEGDGYSSEWEKEAEERRGLENIKTTPLALDAMVTEKAKSLFENNKIYSESEIEARHEIELEKYIKKVQIEGRVMVELASSHILPSAVRYQNVLLENVQRLKEAGLAEGACTERTKTLNKISEHINKVSTLTEEMIEARKKCNKIEDSREKAIAYCEEVKEKYFDAIRYHADKLEQMVEDKEWSLPNTGSYYSLDKFVFELIKKSC
jgi:glutamine synthetase